MQSKALILTGMLSSICSGSGLEKGLVYEHKSGAHFKFNRIEHGNPSKLPFCKIPDEDGDAYWYPANEYALTRIHNYKGLSETGFPFDLTFQDSERYIETYYKTNTNNCHALASEDVIDNMTKEWNSLHQQTRTLILRRLTKLYEKVRENFKLTPTRYVRAQYKDDKKQCNCEGLWIIYKYEEEGEREIRDVFVDVQNISEKHAFKHEVLDSIRIRHTPELEAMKSGRSGCQTEDDQKETPPNGDHDDCTTTAQSVFKSHQKALNDWLTEKGRKIEKKSNSWPYNWQRRDFFSHDRYILRWEKNGDTQYQLKEGNIMWKASPIVQRSMPLDHGTECVLVGIKDDKKKKYHFKFKTNEERDQFARLLDNVIENFPRTTRRRLFSRSMKQLMKEISSYV